MAVRAFESLVFGMRKLRSREPVLRDMRLGDLQQIIAFLGRLNSMTVIAAASFRKRLGGICQLFVHPFDGFFIFEGEARVVIAQRV